MSKRTGKRLGRQAGRQVSRQVGIKAGTQDKLRRGHRGREGLDAGKMGLR